MWGRDCVLFLARRRGLHHLILFFVVSFTAASLSKLPHRLEVASAPPLLQPSFSKLSIETSISHTHRYKPVEIWGRGGELLAHTASHKHPPKSSKIWSRSSEFFALTPWDYGSSEDSCASSAGCSKIREFPPLCWGFCYKDFVSSNISPQSFIRWGNGRIFTSKKASFSSPPCSSSLDVRADSPTDSTAASSLERDHVCVNPSHIIHPPHALSFCNCVSAPLHDKASPSSDNIHQFSHKFSSGMSHLRHEDDNFLQFLRQKQRFFSNMHSNKLSFSKKVGNCEIFPKKLPLHTVLAAKNTVEAGVNNILDSAGSDALFSALNFPHVSSHIAGVWRFYLPRDIVRISSVEAHEEAVDDEGRVEGGMSSRPYERVWMGDDGCAVAPSLECNGVWDLLPRDKGRGLVVSRNKGSHTILPEFTLKLDHAGLPRLGYSYVLRGIFTCSVEPIYTRWHRTVPLHAAQIVGSIFKVAESLKDSPDSDSENKEKENENSEKSLAEEASNPKNSIHQKMKILNSLGLDVTEKVLSKDFQTEKVSINETLTAGDAPTNTNEVEGISVLENSYIHPSTGKIWKGVCVGNFFGYRILGIDEGPQCRKGENFFVGKGPANLYNLLSPFDDIGTPKVEPLLKAFKNSTVYSPEELEELRNYFEDIRSKPFPEDENNVEKE